MVQYISAVTVVTVVVVVWAEAALTMRKKGKRRSFIGGLSWRFTFLNVTDGSAPHGTCWS